MSVQCVTRLLLLLLHSSEETRPFNVIVDDSNGVTCLVLDRHSYREMIADELSRLKRQESFRSARKKYATNIKNTL
jgi:hypothetical protein